MTRQAYVLLEKKVVIFYSYKSGNSSLVEWVFEMVKPKAKGGIEPKRKRPFLSSPNIGVNAALAFDLITKHGFKGVILTRDPYKRAVSGFINKFVRDGNLWLRIDRGYEKCAIELMTNTSKFSFIDYLNAISELKQSHNDRRLNPHFRTQVDPRYSRFMKLLRIVKIENIAHDLGGFCLENNIPFDRFPRERATDTADANLFEGDASFTDCYELAQSRCVPAYEQMFSKYAIELINQIYDIDFVFLGYEKMVN
jgi:hypothetical protein